MTEVTETQLREKLRKIHALYVGAGTEGEKTAAGNALKRIQAKLKIIPKISRIIESKFLLNNRWSRQLFVALCRRYDLHPYRYPGQRHTTVVLKARKQFIEEVLWPEYKALNKALCDYLSQATEKIISEEVFHDTTDADVVDEPLKITAVQ